MAVATCGTACRLAVIRKKSLLLVIKVASIVPAVLLTNKSGFLHDYSYMIMLFSINVSVSCLFNACVSCLCLMLVSHALFFVSLVLLTQTL